jgi:uncharacterized protein (TIGR00725 family)
MSRGAVYVAVVGASQPSDAQLAAAETIGRRLAEGRAIVVTGGRGGVMAAASRGAKGAGGMVVGILPGDDRADANEWVDVVLPTGLGELRNGLVVRSADAIVAVGGAYGTLSEIALALNARKPVVGYDTWEVRGIELAPTPQEAAERTLELARERVERVRRRA